MHDLNKVIEIDPNEAIGYNNRGYIMNHIGKFEEAITDYTKSI
jgi:Flp pilus assembly protein TadD